MRKKHDWDRLLKLPLKVSKKEQVADMTNLLGGLMEEIEANRFKPQLIEESEITYSKGKLTGFEDQFEWTEESVMNKSISKKTSKERQYSKRSKQHTVKKSIDYGDAKLINTHF